MLIVDDSPTARAALRAALAREPGITVVGEAEDGEQAIHLVTRMQPSIVTMDVYLRRESGLDVARAIMAQSPRPILAVTAAKVTDPQLIYRAMDAGVLDVVGKLPAAEDPRYDSERRALVRRLMALSSVPVVRRRERCSDVASTRELASEGGHARQTRDSSDRFDIVVVGASTGGPPVVEEILRALPPPFPVPVVVVQHMASGFLQGFATWLGSGTGHDVVLVSSPLKASSGMVYVASDDAHVQLEDGGILTPRPEPPHRHHRPSIDILFESVARAVGGNAAAVILTGMGDDGVRGLKALRECGALTIAQDPDTCAVDSMPRKAIADGSVALTLRPEEIGPLVASRCGAVR